MSRMKGIFFVVLALLVASPAFAQTPAATQSASSGPLVTVGTTPDFPKILVGDKGMTLYMFSADSYNNSTCVDKCAQAWPPLTVKSADQLTSADGIPGTFGTFARPDGSLQVTYNGMPLYYWFRDKKAGDTTGNRVTRNWWVVPPATVAIEYNAKLGRILSGPNGMTVYMFKKDSAGTTTSACTGNCATTWPAVTVKSADALVPGVNLPGKFATIKRDDGSLQVTYNGWPLYNFAKDQALGDANGEAVGNSWYTIVPETVVKSSSGDALTTYDGMTLYTYAKDSANTSTCAGDCLAAWPAFALELGAVDRLAAGDGVTGKLGTLTRDDNKAVQVTYNGMPLYVVKTDKKPGDVTGKGVSPDWSIAQP